MSILALVSSIAYTIVAAAASNGRSNTDDIATWGAIGGALATFLTAIVALVIAIWGDWLRSLFTRPKLTLSIDTKPPDCLKIMSRGQGVREMIEPKTGKLFAIPVPVAFPTYYLRLAVGNSGNSAATNVVVRAVKLWRQTDEGLYEEDRYFMPLNLIWANSRTPEQPGGSIVAARIDPELPRHCDLAHIDQAESDLLKFDTEVEPHDVQPGVWPSKKGAGTYRLRVAIAADNRKPVYRNLDIAFSGGWYNEEAQMFEKGIRVTVGSDQ